MTFLFKSFYFRICLMACYLHITLEEEVSKSHKGYFWRIRSLLAAFLKTKID